MKTETTRGNVKKDKTPMEMYTVFTFLLVKKESGHYMGYSRAKDKPECKDLSSLEWVEWNKELPDDIDDKPYVLQDGELIETEAIPEINKTAELRKIDEESISYLRKITDSLSDILKKSNGKGDAFIQIVNDILEQYPDDVAKIKELENKADEIRNM